MDRNNSRTLSDNSAQKFKTTVERLSNVLDKFQFPTQKQDDSELEKQREEVKKTNGRVEEFKNITKPTKKHLDKLVELILGVKHLMSRSSYL